MKHASFILLCLVDICLVPASENNLQGKWPVGCILLTFFFLGGMEAIMGESTSVTSDVKTVMHDGVSAVRDGHLVE